MKRLLKKKQRVRKKEDYQLDIDRISKILEELNRTWGMSTEQMERGLEKISRLWRGIREEGNREVEERRGVR